MSLSLRRRFNSLVKIIMVRDFRVFHPFLFAFYPVVTIYTLNIFTLEISSIFRSIILLEIGTFITLALLRLLFKNWDRAGLMTTFIIVTFLYINYTYKIPGQMILFGASLKREAIVITIWIILLVTLTSKWFWSHLSPKRVTNLLNIVSLILLIFPLVPVLIASYLYLRDPLRDWELPGDNEIFKLPSNSKPEYLPDIYYIIVDGYGRADVLESMYGFDNSEFLQSLSDRGFFIAHRSQSNYIQTALSVSSSLNMQYLEFPANATNSIDRSQLQKMIQNSKMRQFLELLGYKTIYISSGYLLLNDEGSDLYLSLDQEGLNDFECLLLESGASRFITEIFGFKYPNCGAFRHRQKIRYVFEKLTDVSSMEGPKFVFAHVIAPHPPFVFDRYGNPINSERPLEFWDGSLFQGSTREYVAGSNEQLIFVNNHLVSILDVILSNSKKPPIIILQSDHGPGASLDYNSIENSCLKERFSILNAYYLTDGDDVLYESISPVNTFRVIFDELFETDFGLIPDRQYFSSWSRPFNLIDVTENSETNCSIMD